MRIFLLTIFTVLLFTSCSRYQYVTINGTDIKKNEKQEFVAENDSLRIQYNFNGHDGPINLTIQNKLDVPLYVDWQQSALIINDKAISYAPNTIPIRGELNSTSLSWTSNVYSTTSGSIDAKVTLPETFEFIPPHSYITKSPMGITNQIISNVPDSAFRKEKVPVSGSSPIAVKHAAFTQSSSPLQFKSYLTLLFGDKNAKPIPYQYSFYISDVYATGLDPENFWYSDKSRGDQYYIKETTGFGKGFGVVGGIALLSTVEALNQTVEEKSGK